MGVDDRMLFPNGTARVGGTILFVGTGKERRRPRGQLTASLDRAGRLVARLPV
jgi:hypothetical protein